MTTVTLTPHTPAENLLIALDEARALLAEATEAANERNFPAAVFAAHSAIEYVVGARDYLIGRLIPSVEDD